MTTVQWVTMAVIVVALSTLALAAKWVGRR